MTTLINQVNNALPQTQCKKCGYKDCYNYAKAIISGEEHNRCPTGGQETINKLSTILNREVLSLNENFGKHRPKEVAIINEDLCVGCTKCILSCPVDAIIGSKNLMHTVISNECTGCNLCVTVCPMDCIEMKTLPLHLQPISLNRIEKKKQTIHYKLQYLKRNRRLIEEKRKETKLYKCNNISNDQLTSTRIKSYIQQAVINFQNKKNKILISHE